MGPIKFQTKRKQCCSTWYVLKITPCIYCYVVFPFESNRFFALRSVICDSCEQRSVIFFKSKKELSQWKKLIIFSFSLKLLANRIFICPKPFQKIFFANTCPEITLRFLFKAISTVVICNMYKAYIIICSKTKSSLRHKGNKSCLFPEVFVL